MENNLIKQLQFLKGLGHSPEEISALKKRVMNEIQPQYSTLSPIQPMSLMFKSSAFAGASFAFAVLLVVANQLPMHGAYRDSIAMVVTAQKSGESLDQSVSPASIAQVREVTMQTRSTLDTLKLKGAFAQYTSQDCRHAYELYDGYLDYTATVLDAKIASEQNPATITALNDLRAYIEDSKAEAQKRINMYPSTN